MKTQRKIGIEDVLRRKDALYGRRVEFITGDCRVAEGMIAKTMDVWEGTLGQIAIAEYSGSLLLAIEMVAAKRFVKFTQRGYVTEDSERCQFEVNPLEFQAYEWSGGDISLQAGTEGLDDLFLIRAPQQLLLGA